MIPIADTWHGKNCGVVFPRSRWGLTWLDPLDPYPARCYARALAWTLATSWIPGMREVDDLAISRLCWSRSMIFHDISWYFMIFLHPWPSGLLFDCLKLSKACNSFRFFLVAKAVRDETIKQSISKPFHAISKAGPPESCAMPHAGYKRPKIGFSSFIQYININQHN